MNREAVYEQLKIDEGVVYGIYNDHLGYPTFGVGHLIVEDRVGFHDVHQTASRDDLIDSTLGERLADDLRPLDEMIAEVGIVLTRVDPFVVAVIGVDRVGLRGGDVRGQRLDDFDDVAARHEPAQHAPERGSDERPA